VLEAISQLRFLVRDGEPTTKFVTKVVLRNDASAVTTPVTLKLLANRDRTPEQKAHLKKFRFAVDVNNPEAFTDAVNAALEFLKVYEPKTKFWYDRLHVEISVRSSQI
jgi:transcriptional regulator of nitric oxide reductase